MQKSDIPSTLPLLPLKDVVVFPDMIIPIFVSEEVCLKIVEASFEQGRHIFLSAFRSEDPKERFHKELECSTEPPFDVYDVGCVAKIIRFRKMPDGKTKILIHGISRARLVKVTQTTPFPIVELAVLPSQVSEASSAKIEQLVAAIKNKLKNVPESDRLINPEVVLMTEGIKEPSKLSDILASHLNLDIVDSQYLLGNFDPFSRLTHIYRQIEMHIQSEEKNQKEKQEVPAPNLSSSAMQFLKQQKSSSEMEELKKQIQQKNMPKKALDECLKCISRLERMAQESNEANILRTFLEWMVDLPWTPTGATHIDFKRAKEILDEHHHGLDKVKDRILEFIAVKKMNSEARSPILCFYGPPGVGKTSLGKSIAEALGKSFARISLGGVKDESEIRGHRRTYVGALPGRIIQAMKLAGALDPVIMLDEIDKIGTEGRGDPANALLEVLDPEQNCTFSDHYIHVPYDLSKVTFIANANRIDTIPVALRDRLEIIEVPGYSEEEKVEIARKHLIPRVFKENGIPMAGASFSEGCLTKVIEAYTRESGVRKLQERLSSVARKIARTMAEEQESKKSSRKKYAITERNLSEFLGAERYPKDDISDIKKGRIGVSFGLAYTQYGGDVLELEVKLIQGKGNFILTGQLGDVMKESARTALSCIRSLPKNVFEAQSDLDKYDIHIHVPSGGIPKDGPSAGIALASALFSALTGRPIRHPDELSSAVAMTGELTLHGRVLPVGGIREKVLAAVRYGFKMVIVPDNNRSSIIDIPEELRDKIEIKFVSNFQDVLNLLFKQNKTDMKKTRSSHSNLLAS